MPVARIVPWLLAALLLPLAASFLAGHRPRWHAVAQLAAIVTASAGALGAGRAGAASSIRHITTVHAFAGTTATIAESRMAIDAARDGALRATLQADGGALEVPGPGQRPQSLDDAGHAVVDLPATLGGSYRLDAEYPGPVSPVRIARHADGISIAHLGPAPLTGCTFPHSLDAHGATTIESNTTFTANGTVTPGDAVSCLWHAGDPPMAGVGVGVPPGGTPSTLLIHLDTVLP
jgi:hypothetical protein